MSLLDYARSRITTILEEIDQLEGSEFPYEHSKDALCRIKAVFLFWLKQLSTVEPSSDRETINGLCGESLKWFYTYLPYLGFILRSTNVRNAFEMFEPLLDISRMVLEPKVAPHAQTTKLVLSSEWDYVPSAYYKESPDLKDFVLIGLPASESSNPLVIPLSGHELGHCVWVKNNLQNKFGPQIEPLIIEYIKQHWEQYQELYPDLKQDQLQTDMFAREKWSYAKTLATDHAEEIFSDFVGLKIFGTAFLQSFAYLLAPNVSFPRSIKYPNAIKRVLNIIKAARIYKYDIPENYESIFQDRPKPNLLPPDSFKLYIADYVIDRTVDFLISEADGIISATGICMPDDMEIERIYKRLELVVPAEGCKSIADILNAGWIAYNNPNLWNDMPAIKKRKEKVLKELILKNIQIMTTEKIQQAQK